MEIQITMPDKLVAEIDANAKILNTSRDFYISIAVCKYVNIERIANNTLDLFNICTWLEQDDFRDRGIDFK